MRLKIWGRSIFLLFCVCLLCAFAPNAQAAPTITSLTPSTGAVGASVTIAGSSFGSPQGTSTVKFNGTTATVTTWGASSITVTVPTGATTGNVVVTVSGVASNGKAFTVVAAPSITSLTPATGAIGASVTIAGSNFGSSQGSSTVKFNGTTATVTSWSASSIATTVPTGATTGNVVVFASGVNSNGKSFTVVPAPSISGLSPTTGAVGASVTITGSNFGSTQGTSTVKFNGTTATVTSWSASSIAATVPTGATTGNVVVNASGVNSNGLSFSVVAAPSISSLSPTSDAVGASVTIAGSNFGSTQGTSTVKFNGTTATVTSWSASSIAATVPTGATTGNIVVFASGVNSNGKSFTVLGSPSITSLSVSSGAVGTPVTISGSNFGASQGSGMVTFNGAVATVTSWSASSIATTVPAAATSGNVVVYASGVNSNGVSFTVLVAPGITGLTPSSGAAGSSVTIAGNNFGTTQGSSSVTFNGVVATPSSWSSTQIVAPVPSAATSGNVVVQVNGISSNLAGFTVLPTPNITTLSPVSGEAGNTVRITGMNFGATQGTSTVTFNGVSAAVTSWSSTGIVVTVPSGATTGNVVVTVGGIASNGSSFTLLAGPSITSLSPPLGAVGTSITITGTNFGTSQGTNTVSFNGTNSTATSWTSASIAAPVPTGASSGNVVVTVSGIASNSSPFTVAVAPAITSLSPNSGVIGTTVTISGSNFGATQGTSTIAFNGTAATPTAWSANQIVANVPTGATTGNFVVTVGSLSSSGVLFTVNASGPTITSLSPSSGGVGSGVPVTVTGTNFGSTQGSSSIQFGGVGVNPSSWGNTSIGFTTPTLQAPSVNVTVDVGGAISNSSLFTIVPAPTISAISPTSGGVGTPVTITGTNFGSSQGSSTVNFNGTAATPTSWSATSIVVAVPTGASAGTVNVTVAGMTVSSGTSFSILPAITGMSPNPAIAGTSVTITGTNFGATQGIGGSVNFSGAGTATPTSWSDTAIVVPVPNPSATGGVYVRSTQGLGSSAPSNSYNFTVNPSITNLSPNSGTVATSVQINGNGFTFATGTVTFNGVAASPTSWSSNQIVTYPPVGATTGNVVVTAQGVATNGVSFTMQAGPSISTVTPTIGVVGTSVTIAGSGFGSPQGSSTIKFNGTTATPTAWSSTSITAPVPTGTTTGNVVVTVGGVASNGVSFTLDPAPSIGSLSQSSGSIGTPITIDGSNFLDTQGSSTVKFNGTAATPSSWSATEIVIPVPAGATTGNIVITVLGQASTGVGFTVTTAPSISGLSPTSGQVAVMVTVSGSNFGSTQGSNYLTFNGVTATPITWSSSQIKAPVPSGATSGPVVVNIANGPSNGQTFSVTAGPGITSVAPTNGGIGASVTVVGAGFGATQGSNTVKFNGTTASAVSWSDSQIVASVPTGATTGNIVVTVAGVASNGVSFTVTSGISISSITPTSGNTGSSVIIAGSGFGTSQGGSTVNFNGASGTVTSWSGTSISVSVPAGAVSGPASVTVGGATSNGVNFTVAPKISTLVPNPVAQGGTFTISGLNFGSTQGTSSVTCNGNSLYQPTWSANSIGPIDPANCASTTGVFSLNVSVNGVASVPANLTVVASPFLSSVNPPQAAVGTSITIVGSNFGSTQGQSTVTVNGPTAIPTSWSNNQIVVPVPSGATSSGYIVVTVGGVLGSPQLPFNLTTIPSITTLSVNTGGVGTAVTITGSNFGTQTAGSTVSFNGTLATPTSWTNTSIAVTVPTGATTGPVVVTVNYDTSNAITFTVSQLPTIQNLSVTSGAAGAAVTISGANFGTSTGTVTFNGTTATTSNWNSTSISTTVPTSATSGSVVVKVGTTPSNGVNFTVTGNGTLSGTVTKTSDGTAINGASVQAMQNGASQGSATTNSSGVYSITNLAVGNYDVKFSATTFGTAFVNSISVSIGGTTTQNASLATPGGITGQITQAGGGSSPIIGAAVTALQGSESVGGATTDGSGNYTISGLAPGTYSVTVTAGGYVPQSQTSVSVTSGTNATMSLALSAQGTDAITYVYDQLGRLVGVVDAQGDVATYTYDAVGNILSIGQGNASKTSVIEFIPSAGAVGSSVTISGTGFSSTPSSNSVAFNGTSATVSSAAATQLVVSVPTGATSGPISVTSPSGSATSTSSYTVSSSTAAPTISGLSPTTITSVSGTVAITGTNFDVIANDRVKVNVSTLTTLSSVTSTNITAGVPITATSGHVSVSTPNGTTVSTSDLFIPWDPGNRIFFTPVYTGRMSIGGSTSPNFSSAGKGIILFDGTPGQRVYLASSSGCSGSIQDPLANSLTANQGGTTSLSLTGTYSIIAQATAAGTCTFTLSSVPSDVSGQISVNGASVPATTTTTGQMINLTFTAAGGQHATVSWTSNSISNMEMFLYDPTGATVTFNGSGGTSGTLSSQFLAKSGTYTISIFSFSGGTGGITVSVTSP
jgi:YD repeat-containing protein